MKTNLKGRTFQDVEDIKENETAQLKCSIFKDLTVFVKF